MQIPLGYILERFCPGDRCNLEADTALAVGADADAEAYMYPAVDCVLVVLVLDMSAVDIEAGSAPDMCIPLALNRLPFVIAAPVLLVEAVPFA